MKRNCSNCHDWKEGYCYSQGGVNAYVIPRYAANAEVDLYRETDPDFYCSDWESKDNPMNIYTYQIGYIPPLTEATNQEISSLDKIITDLIVNCAGNYHALEKLHQILDDAKDTCYLNLCQIEIVANEKQQ